jgi:nucleosome assembly protein 1-like 1
MKRLALEKEFKALNFKLESKYEALYKPIYEKRVKVLDGTEEVTLDSIKEQLANVNINDSSTTESEKGVPQFWLLSLKNTAQFGQIINKKRLESWLYLRFLTRRQR